MLVISTLFITFINMFSAYYMSGLDDRLLVERLINTCLVPFNLDTNERMKKLLLLFSTIDENASKAFIEVQKSQRQVRHNHSLCWTISDAFCSICLANRANSLMWVLLKYFAFCKSDEGVLWIEKCCLCSMMVVLVSIRSVLYVRFANPWPNFWPSIDNLATRKLWKSFNKKWTHSPGKGVVI